MTVWREYNFIALTELEIRLHGGETHYEGGVEIKLNGTWGTICDDFWGIEEANVICRMLNFTEGALSTQCCGFYNGYGIAEKIWLDDVHCDGDEQSIAECRHGGWGSHNCRHTEDVGVVCKHSPVSAPGSHCSLKNTSWRRLTMSSLCEMGVYIVTSNMILLRWLFFNFLLIWHFWIIHLINMRPLLPLQPSIVR